MSAEECYRIGLCEYVTEEGNARTLAEEIAARIAAFPQGAALADKRSIIESHGRTVPDGLRREWAAGVEVVLSEGAAGAARFAGGAGRHGEFGEFEG